MEFWQPGSYGSLCVGDFNHAANREDRIPNQSGYRLQARDQKTKLTSALDESYSKLSTREQNAAVGELTQIVPRNLPKCGSKLKHGAPK